MFKALLIENDRLGYRCSLKELEEKTPDNNEVTLEVCYSTLNYKDALAIHNRAPIIQAFPMVPGIDFVGRVIESRHASWQPGEMALLTGWGVGEKQWGGLAQKVTVNGSWLVSVPDSLTPQQTMAIGTAGLTAMLCIMTLEHQGVKPENGPVLVTGASGGVGSFSVSLLARLGYQVIAASGRSSDRTYLQQTLGAASVIGREELSQPAKPLVKARWAAAIDSVGSHTLSNILAAMQHDGVVAACGMAQGLDLPTSVAPFILRSVILAGVDSVTCPIERREVAWQRLGDLLDDKLLAAITQTIPLNEAINGAQQLLEGEIRGRLVVDCR